MKIANLTYYGSNVPLSTASPLPTAVEHASVAGYEYTAPQQVNAFTSGYENILDMGFLSGMDTFPDMGSCTGYDADAIIKIVKDSNKDITGHTAYGRNYAGNWAGAPRNDEIIRSWNTNTNLALYRYGLNSNGSITTDRITHPSANFLNNNHGQRNWELFINSFNENPVRQYVDALRSELERRNDQ